MMFQMNFDLELTYITDIIYIREKYHPYLSHAILLWGVLFFLLV